MTQPWLWSFLSGKRLNVHVNPGYNAVQYLAIISGRLSPKSNQFYKVDDDYQRNWNPWEDQETLMDWTVEPNPI